MSEAKFNAAVLVISDTAYKNPSSDQSGPLLARALAGAEQGANWTVIQNSLVPDDESSIQQQVLKLCDGEILVNLIITSGGTGFSPRDRTPEAISPLIQKPAPGLVHGMLAASLQVTPFALMSRPVAGVRNKTVIVTLPGSPKGAEENLLAILKLLPHACLQAAGVDSRSLHIGGVKQLEAEAGISSPKNVHHHHHHHHDHHHHDHGHGHGHEIPKAHTSRDTQLMSNDLRDGPSSRHRSSPYPMLTVGEALHIVLEKSPPPMIVAADVGVNLIGFVLAKDVRAEEAVPAYRASIVDGYALCVSEDGPSPMGILHVASISHASPGDVPALPAGKIARITTGAPLPPGASSVVMVEDTVLKCMTEDGREEKEVELLTNEIKVGENVREVGSDIPSGEIILREGEKISALGGELGLLTSVGRKEVLVYRKPTVGVLSTGDEIVDHNRAGPLLMGEVRDCNRPSLMAAVRGWGYEVVDLGITKDKPETLEASLRTAMRSVDIIVTTGGVSMGELDLLKPTIERSLGGTIHFGRVAMKPGKPTTFATIPFKSNTGERSTNRIIFSLPGNPASAVVTLHLFVLPSLHLSSGVNPPQLPRVNVILQQQLAPDPHREEYRRGIVSVGQDGKLYATVTNGVQRSSAVGSFRSANALLVLRPGTTRLEKGSQVEALLLGPVAVGRS